MEHEQNLFMKKDIRVAWVITEAKSGSDLRFKQTLVDNFSINCHCLIGSNNIHLTKLNLFKH